MPRHGHAQPPADDPEPPPADRQRDAWLSEMWAPVREYRHDDDPPHAALARREQLATFFGDEPASYEQPCRRPLSAA